MVYLVSRARKWHAHRPIVRMWRYLILHHMDLSATHKRNTANRPRAHLQTSRFITKKKYYIFFNSLIKRISITNFSTRLNAKPRAYQCPSNFSSWQDSRGQHVDREASLCQYVHFPLLRFSEKIAPAGCILSAHYHVF